MSAPSKTGRMVRCSNAPCQRRARAIRTDSWKCEGCEQGNAPYEQRRTAAGVKTKKAQ